MRDCFVEHLGRAAAANPDIMLITGDLGFGVLQEFEQKFPAQFLNAGVAEQNMTGLAAGLALEGWTVLTYSIANFPVMRCYEQIRNDICYHNANVKIVSVGAGFSYGSLGISHHATEDLAVMRVLPEMTVLSPGDLWEVGEATGWMLAHPGPVYLRLDKSKAPRTPEAEGTFDPARARILRSGEDVTLAVTGGILEEALKAESILRGEGIGCRVLSYASLKPFDAASLLQAARETGGLVTLEEHSVEGGLGSLAAETCMEAGVLPGFFRRVGLKSRFSSRVGSQDYLRRWYGMDAGALAGLIRDAVRRPGSVAGGVDAARS